MLQQGRRDEACLAIDQAIKTNPRYLEAVNASALLHFGAGSYDAAIARFDQSLQIKPGDPGAFHLRGVARLRLKRFDEAHADIARALELAPDHPEVTTNLGLVLQRLGRHEEAMVYFDKALALKPDLADAFNHRGTSLQDLHRFDEALANFACAVAVEPDYADAHWNAALLRLLLGDFATGWAGREWGRQCKAVGFVDRRFTQPLWLGEKQSRARPSCCIAMRAWAIPSSSRAMCRWSLRPAHGSSWKCRIAVHPLLSGIRGRCALPAAKPAPRCPTSICTARCPACRSRSERGSRRFRRDLLSAAASRSTLCRPGRPGSAPHDKLRVGLVWSGNPAHGNDRNRSMPLRMLSPILDLDATFVSLQKDPRPDDQACCASSPRSSISPRDLTDFAETAALISCLDLVITVDTSVAHLAGALGRPTWILLPYTPDYRWLLDRDDSPWYPTVRLFRQTETARLRKRARTGARRADQRPALPRPHR